MMRLLPPPLFHPRAFRVGVLPFLSDREVMAGRYVLRYRPDLLVRGKAVEPSAIYSMASMTPVGACFIGAAAWLARGLATALDVAEAYEGAKDGARGQNILHLHHYFTKWWDSPKTDITEVRRLLLPLVEAELARRRGGPRGLALADVA